MMEKLLNEAYQNKGKPIKREIIYSHHKNQGGVQSQYYMIHFFFPNP